MKKISFTFSYFFLTLLAFSFSAAAQTAKPPQTPPVNNDDVVKISTTLIQLDVTVTDKKGNIVTDLKSEDFEVYENGKKQDISNFSFISTDSRKLPTENAVHRGSEFEKRKSRVVRHCFG